MLNKKRGRKPRNNEVTRFPLNIDLKLLKRIKLAINMHGKFKNITEFLNIAAENEINDRSKVE